MINRNRPHIKFKSHLTIFINRLEPKSPEDLKVFITRWHKRCIEIRDRRLEIRFARLYGNYLLGNHFEIRFSELHPENFNST